MNWRKEDDFLKPTALVFFDLDGTLLNQHSEVEADVVKAITDLKAKGGVPIIATGRTNIEFQHVVKATDIHSSISMNGQFITYEGTEIYRSVLPRETVRRLKDATDERGLGLSFYTDKWIRTTVENDTVKKAYQFIHTGMPEIDPTIHLNEDIFMALVLNEEVHHDQYFRETFPELSFYRNTPYSMDTISNGNSKATGIKQLQKQLGLEHVPTFAFGDGPNDLEMFGIADYSVAMGNGISELKEQASFVAKSNLDGGIIEGLQHFDLI